MFSLTIKNVSVFFTKFFAGHAGKEVIEKIRDASAYRVVFVDTGATPVLVEAIKTLREEGIEVVVRDHHRGEGRTPEAAELIEAMLGDNARIVERATAPGCAQLVELGEFQSGAFSRPMNPNEMAGYGVLDFDYLEYLPVEVVVVADPDLDGLTAAMKACGVTYEGLDADAAVFDGPRAAQSAETLSGLGWLVVRAMATLPPYNAARPEVSENAKAALFGEFVSAATGDEAARGRLEGRVSEFEAQVAEAERLLAERVTELVPGVLGCDTQGAGRYDLATLSRGLEERGAVITVLISTPTGPFAAAGWGTRYSLSVVQKHQRSEANPEGWDLRDLVPEGTETGMEHGLLSNTAYLLHCGKEVWEETILPELAMI